MKRLNQYIVTIGCDWPQFDEPKDYGEIKIIDNRFIFRVYNKYEAMVWAAIIISKLEKEELAVFNKNIRLISIGRVYKSGNVRYLKLKK